MLENIKKWSMVLGTIMLLASCSNDMEDVNPSSALGAVSSDAAKVASTTSPLAISDLTTTDGKTWMFTVQKTATGNVANIGSVLLTLTGCDNQQIALSGANVVSASVTGSLTQTLTPTYKEGNGSACDMSAVTGYLRLTDFQEKLTDGNVYTVSFTLSEPIQVKTATVWARISNSCHMVSVNGPGCEIMDICGKGQGYFHKSEKWEGKTVTIGGYTYIAQDGVKFFTSDKREGAQNNSSGIADAKAAFAQGATVLLNRQLGLISPNAYAAELAVIDAYLLSLGKKLTEYELNSLPTGNDAAKKAAGYIGDNIDCEDAE